MTLNSAAPSEVLLLSEQVREVHLGLIALSSMIEAGNLQSDRVQGSTHSDMTLLRREHKELEEKLEHAICGMQCDLEALRSCSSSNARSIEELLAVVQELRAPVQEMVALRSRVGGLILGLGVLGSVTMWLAEPIYRWIVEHHFPK